MSPFNVSYNKGLVMMNSINLTLSGKHFICPPIRMMRTLASNVWGVMDEMRQIHTDHWGPVEEKGPHSPQEESAPTLALTGFYWLSNSIHQRQFSFIMLRFSSGNYFLQIAKERILLITSYRLTRKKCCKCKWTIRVIDLITLQSLGELA